jgi:predicted enzyme related to lactoylglutathione lyase
MANIAYVEIPADDIARAKKFYHSLLGWKIEPTASMADPEMKEMMASMQYQDIELGGPEEGTVNMGGMYKRQMPRAPIVTYVLVDDIDAVLANVVRLGGSIVVPKNEIKNVGLIALIQDTEGNVIGLWKSAMKK